MGTTQKYSLKWNDFTINVASTFRDLHSRHDFVDVTLACADGSTLEAHKVILSSVSTYFRDILKQTPCKHPIIILKDTGRDEAAAMLEFAYTGEVNVAQELLPSLLHTARCFKIKGLDKVESPIEQPLVPCPRMEAQTPSSEHWVESAPPTRSHTPSSIHSQHDAKSHADHFVSDKSNVTPTATNLGNLLRSVEHERERQLLQNNSPPPSLPGSQPPTRDASPCPQMSGGNFNARTPPPKRWKRSFDMTQPTNMRKEGIEQPLSLISENAISGRDDYECLKRFREPGPSAACNGSMSTPRSAPYPHSLPTSPTMFERGHEIRLAGLFRHHLSNSQQVVSTSLDDGRCSPSPKTSTPQQQATSTTTDSAALDYRCYPTLPKSEPQSECEYPQTNGRHLIENGERYKSVNSSLDFRPESAPTVLDMSPDGSLSGPPSVRTSDLTDLHRDEDLHSHNGEDFSDCAKAFSIRPDGMGQYTCDECGKIFKHPGSLQHHRHIHRGTHRCPSCGKAFSRRWDMERHLNKSKYGCPANRFSGGGDSVHGSPSPSPSPVPHGGSAGPGAMMNSTTHLEILAAVSNPALHNTTA